MPSPLKTVNPIAREEKDQDHYPIVLESRFGQELILWGYNAGPSAMTRDGRYLLVNVSHYLK